MRVAHNGSQGELWPLPGKGGSQWRAEFERQLLGVVPCPARPDKPLPTAGVPGPSSVQEMLAQTLVALRLYV